MFYMDTSQNFKMQFVSLGLTIPHLLSLFQYLQCVRLACSPPVDLPVGLYRLIRGLRRMRNLASRLQWQHWVQTFCLDFIALRLASD